MLGENPQIGKSLLMCIAFHYSEDRIKYLRHILDNIFYRYETHVHIIIDTDIESFPSEYLFRSNIKIVSHTNLKHPFHLTWCHRAHIKENIDKYDNFMYIEDDMYLPFENYLHYLECFKVLWPRFVPSFIRIEHANNKIYTTDAKDSQKLIDSDIVTIKGLRFTTLNNPYHAFWIMPQAELKETMIKDFDRLSDSRETAASYPMWELKKTPMVRILKHNNSYKVNALCWAYHLPNNYALSKESPFGKVELENIFI